MVGAGAEIQQEFIEEVEGYIPSMQDSIRKLKGNMDDRQTQGELHRLSHTICGAASMVGLADLSRMAREMEAVLEDVISGKTSIDDGLHRALEGALHHIAAYCRSFPSDEKKAREMVRKTLLLFRQAGTLSRPSQVPVAAQEGVSTGLDDLLSEDDPGPLAFEEEDPAFPRHPKTHSEESLPETDLLISFHEEAGEHLEDMGRQLNLIQSRVVKSTPISDEERETIRLLRRSVHTLKGAASMVGVTSIAGWGHDFEDFMDWLYEEAREISPAMVEVMLDALDILEEMASDPGSAFSSDTEAIKKRFSGFMEMTSGMDRPEEVKPAVARTREEPAGRGATAAGTMEPAVTLRVDLKRIEDMVGQAGELSIAISSFDQNLRSFKESLNELNLTFNRLKGIAENLEAGYELATIPHVGGIASGAAVGDEKDPGSEFEDFDPLELDRYSELNIIIRSLNEATADLGTIQSQAESLCLGFEDSVNRQRSVLDGLQNTMTHVRMSPLSGHSNRLFRIVRETARQAGKKARLIIEGESIEMDKRVWERLADPLMHLLRNAVDHGIEPEERRLELGKPPEGLIHLKASRRGNQVIVEIGDDGAGLDYEAIRERAKDTVSPERASGMSRDELAALIFKPGFSSRTKVTELSGRGVGMDIVQNAVRELKGGIEVTSREGSGVTFTIRLPIMAALFRALLVRLGDQDFAFHMNEIESVTRSDALDRENDVVKIGNESLPFIKPARILGTGNGRPPDAVPDKPIILVVEADGRRYAMGIDGLLGQQDIVFKNLGSHLRRVKCVSGVTIMGDGRIVPILNADELVAEDLGLAGARQAVERPTAKADLNILVADDSVSVRRILSRFIKGRGWKPHMAKDGVDAMEKVRGNAPDLILLDIEMPRMNGFEVLHALRSHDELRNTPVLMLTSRTAKKYRGKAANLGANGFVTKPFNEDELARLIMQLTSKAGIS